jgi:hypothetical protein
MPRLSARLVLLTFNTQPSYKRELRSVVNSVQCAYVELPLDDSRWRSLLQRLCPRHLGSAVAPVKQRVVSKVTAPSTPDVSPHPTLL